MSPNGFDLAASARAEMIAEGFQPDFPPGVAEQLAAIDAARAPVDGVRDLRGRGWSSIDNDDSRDLDQIEVAERAADGGIRVLIGIADVAGTVACESPIDGHAEAQTTTVYAGVEIFPMLPERLSTGLTSLLEGEDRLAMVIEYTVAADGSFAAPAVYPARVANKAQLTYNGVGPWLEGTAPPPAKVAADTALAAQLRLQDEAAQRLREHRHKLGALEFERAEAEPVIRAGRVEGIVALRQNRAAELIEDFMVAANEVTARTLGDAQVCSIRRVVKTPERWPRIVELALRYGTTLPAQPDAGALNEFLRARRTADPDHYADVSLAVVKLMGPGEYVAVRPGDPGAGHFALAVRDYTHSTAPNRRFADIVTQRLLRIALAGKGGPAGPYSDDRLTAIARNCTLKEDAARKVERTMHKRIAAVALAPRVGETFRAVVTGVTPKGVFVRVMDPPVEGRVMHGELGLDVGDRVTVRLLATDPRRGFIDFGREGKVLHE